MPLTAQALQRLGALLEQYGPKAATVSNPGANSNFGVLNDPLAQAAPPPSAAPPVNPQQFVPQTPAVSPEGLVNQNPPAPNPPLASAPPPVMARDFGGASSVPAQSQTPAVAPAPSVANMPAPVGSDPSMADETVRQTLAKVLKGKMLPAQWAQNFGNLADQSG